MCVCVYIYIYIYTTVCFVLANLEILLSLGSYWPDLLQGLNKFQDLLPIYCISIQTLTAGVSVSSDHRSSQVVPRWSDQKSEASYSLSLKSKQD